MDGKLLRIRGGDAWRIEITSAEVRAQSAGRKRMRRVGTEREELACVVAPEMAVAP